MARRALIITFLVLTGLPVGCVEPEPEGVSIHVLYPVGGRGDFAFSDSMHSGIAFARWRFNSQVRESTPQNVDELRNHFADAVHSGAADLIITAGEDYATEIEAAGCDFSGQRVLHFNQDLSECDDLKTVSFQTRDPSFIAGVAAMEMSQTGVVGAIGAASIPSVNDFIIGFQDGVTHAGGGEISVMYIADEPPTATAQGGQQLAAQMYDGGVDIIIAPAGGATDGILAEVERRVDERPQGEPISAWVIGTVGDQSSRSPAVLGSVLKRLDWTVVDIVSDLTDGRFASGSVTLGHSDGSTEFLVSPLYEAEIGQVARDAEADLVTSRTQP